MSITCSVFGHVPQSIRHHNQGMDFSICHHCGCDLIRAGEDWTEVPRGFRVVWREFGRADDAAGVAERMRRLADPAQRRRDTRTERLPVRRDKRGRPISGAMSMLGTLAMLGELLNGGEEAADTSRNDVGEQSPIRLPGQARH